MNSYTVPILVSCSELIQFLTTSFSLWLYLEIIFVVHPTRNDYDNDFYCHTPNACTLILWILRFTISFAEFNRMVHSNITFSLPIVEELLILISAIDLAITSNTCCKYKCGICSQTTYRCWLIGLSDLNTLLCQCIGQKVIWGISVWAIQDIYCCVEDKMCYF